MIGELFNHMADEFSVKDKATNNDVKGAVKLGVNTAILALVLH